MSTTSLQRILVPTDLSDFAAGAIRWAALLQRRLGGRITALYANQPWVPFDVMEGPAAYALQTSVEFRDRIARDLAEWVERYLPEGGDAVESRIVDQAPAQAILEMADAIDADLIVMGTHGRTGWRRALLGSVAEKVVHHTDRAVLCIPPDVTPSIGKILCPVNFTEVARVALEDACALAATFDAELLIVHIADALGDGPDVEGEFTAWIDPSVRDRCRYTHVLAVGHAAEETIRLAHESRADLIVLGSQHKRFAGRERDRRDHGEGGAVCEEGGVGGGLMTVAAVPGQESPATPSDVPHGRELTAAHRGVPAARSGARPRKRSPRHSRLERFRI